MENVITLLKDLPLFSGLDQSTLHYLAGLAERKRYEPNDWLFHESTRANGLALLSRAKSE